MRILFILKKNECYSFKTLHRRSSGLWNSTQFITRSLKSRGIHADIVEVVDNNCIDREVAQFRPDVVVIEALWVVPEKYDVLKKLHPKVRWYVHLHSDMPFLALEGIAMSWILDCAQRGVRFIANSKESYGALSAILSPKELVYLPNVYITKPNEPHLPERGILEIGCFGAVRPLKNQLLQALAAIEFAKRKKKRLKFWINGTRTETGGDPVLKNLLQLFERTPDTMLCQSKWNEPDEFIGLLQTMDIGMQVSLTETFNVVTADYVTAGIPIVVSKEVKWASRFCQAKDNSVDDIVRVMERVYRNKCLVRWNQRLLNRNSKKAQELWYRFARDHE